MTQRRTTPIQLPIVEAHSCTPEKKLDVLSQVPLFEQLDGTDLFDVYSACRSYDFFTGDSVYQAGDSARSFYVVAAGLVKVTRVHAEGRETLLDILGPGDFLGALPALGQDHYTQSAWAMTPTCLLGLGAEKFDLILARHPSVARATLKGVSLRLSESQEAVHLLSGAPLEQRLAAVLGYLADKAGAPWQGGILVQIPLSREELAAMVGATTESVSRLISEWHKSGLIEAGRRWIAIQDRGAIDDLANS